MPGFRMLRRFDDPELAGLRCRRERLTPLDARWFPGDGLVDRFARELCERRTVPFRELLEAFEFFALARKHSRAPVVADLCGGHGLVAALFAVFEGAGAPRGDAPPGVVEEALVLDRTRPASFERVRAAAEAVRPGAAARIRFERARLTRADRILPAEASLLAVHACGDRTDDAIGLALARRVPLAVVPCCHRAKSASAPPALLRELGIPLAVDVDRTYRLECAGFHVKWRELPSGITHMPRVILARPETVSGTSFNRSPASARSPESEGAC